MALMNDNAPPTAFEYDQLDDAEIIQLSSAIKNHSCSCGSPGRYADEHKTSCTLFRSDEFFSDQAEWDMETQTLVPVEMVQVYDEWREDLEDGHAWEGFTDIQRARWHEAYKADDMDEMNAILDEISAAELDENLGLPLGS